MTNREWLNNLNNEEFTDYITSVFLAGKYLGENQNNKIIMEEYNIMSVDYINWLEEIK